jgi:ethanolamine utilization protein EutA
MAERLRSIGLDVGTTTTQFIVSELTVQNRASAFAVPRLEIGQRQVLYRSPVYFTPLIGENLVDGEKIREIVTSEYEKAFFSIPVTSLPTVIFFKLLQ